MSGSQHVTGRARPAAASAGSRAAEPGRPAPGAHTAKPPVRPDAASGQADVLPATPGGARVHAAAQTAETRPHGTGASAQQGGGAASLCAAGESAADAAAKPAAGAYADPFTGWRQPGVPEGRPGDRRTQRQALPYGPRPARQPKPLRAADVVYSYDGSFPGFLCCVFTAIARGELPFGIWPPERQQPTFYPVVPIATEPDHARRVLRAYRRLAGATGQRLLATAFLACVPDKERDLLRFCHLVFAEGGRALSLLGHPAVAAVYAMDRAVGREAEHWKGFLRFSEADGMLGAVMHPAHIVLPLLEGHFCSRFPEERFLIWDAAHDLALLYQDHRPALLRLAAPLDMPAPDAAEQQWQALWRQFYRTLGIDARRNEALRASLCPRRFWPDMTELRDAR